MMKIFLYFLMFHFIHLNQWTWISGPNVVHESNQNRIIEPLYRQRFASFKINNELFLFGGRFSQLVRVRELNNEVWKYNLNTKSWSLVKNGTGKVYIK